MERKRLEVKQILVLIFCLFISIYAVRNGGLSIKPLQNCLKGEISFQEAVVQLQDNYKSDDLLGKDYYININGFFAKLLGKSECNDVIKLSNGMLTQAVNRQDVTETGNGIVDLSNYLNEQDIQFLFVMAPYKEDINDELLPVGVESYANENGDDLIAILQENNVDVLDLRPDYVSTSEQMEQYFYVTDHHWNIQGSFVGYQKITEQILMKFPYSNIDMTYTDLEQWESHTKENWFLGSWGKRVGRYYGGVDDITWYEPLFETKMSCSIPGNKFYYGDFSDAVIREGQVEEKNFFHKNPYAIYMGQDWPLVQHRNASAPSDLKVLLIKDSYGIPIEVYMSTMYQELDVIDTREFDECSVAEYIQRTQPDIVIMMINAGNSRISEECYHEFGVEDVVLEHNYEPIIQEEEVYIASSNNNNNRISYDVDAGETYKISIEQIELSSEENGVTVALYNATEGTVISTRIIDVGYYNEQDNFEWVLDTPDIENAELKILLYAGISGKTQNVDATYSGVNILISN